MLYAYVIDSKDEDSMSFRYVGIRWQDYTVLQSRRPQSKQSRTQNIGTYSNNLCEAARVHEIHLLKTHVLTLRMEAPCSAETLLSVCRLHGINGQTTTFCCCRRGSRKRVPQMLLDLTEKNRIVHSCWWGQQQLIGKWSFKLRTKSFPERRSHASCIILLVTSMDL
jgi:hypothetical protein